MCGLQILGTLPSGEGELIAVRNLPITITPNESFNEAKRTLESIVAQVGSIAQSIKTDDEYNAAIAGLQAVNKFIKDIEAGAKPGKDQLNAAKSKLMDFIHELDQPAAKLKDALARETARYLLHKQELERQEQARLQREAEAERARQQRIVDLGALKAELATAEQEAVSAEGREHPETAKEIRQFLKRFAALESQPGAFQNPLQDATGVRQAVALAIQHEQGRIAAAKAKAEGDKAAARRIEQASKKLAAPEVAQVTSQRVETQAVVAPKADLDKAKGQHVKRTWKARIIEPALVPREFCEPSESLLNQYANRIGTVPQVAGVVFDEVVKTAGVRA